MLCALWVSQQNLKPALVFLCAAACRRKASEVNKKLGEKFEISETELLSTVEACSALLAEGQDLDTGEGATQVRRRQT
jgi:hypothetical protein